jgi:mannose-1-phosphate guanylyltransferase
MLPQRFIVIMAGGVGSRFWPSSTNEKPKQFLDILGIGKSLIRMTFERSLSLVPAENIFILTNQKYKTLVKQHLPELPENNILCEPSMNNTAPCIAYSALRLKAIHPNSVFAVLPSDHVILKETEYQNIMEKAFSFAENNNVLVTLGIQPSRPDTGYGYIQCGESANEKDIKYDGFKKVLSFREKPDQHTAEAYLKSGDYLWNAGMFIWSVSAILDAFTKYAEDILTVLSEKEEMFGTSEEQNYIDQVYPSTRSISIDYAIMEQAENVYTIPAEIGWSDLGTWNSLHAYLESGDSTVKIGDNIHLIDCEDVMVMSNNQKNIVIKGLKDYIVVDEDHAILIYPKSAEQEIKEVVQRL